MPWFWGSSKKKEEDDEDGSEYDDDDDDDEEYSTGSEYEEDDDDDEEAEEEESYDSEEEEEEGSIEEDEEKDDKDPANREIQENGKANDKQQQQQQQQQKQTGDDSSGNDNDNDDEYDIPLTDEMDNHNKKKDPNDNVHSSHSVGAESISVGNEDLSLIHSDHRSDDEDFLETDEEDDDNYSSSSSSDHDSTKEENSTDKVDEKDKGQQNDSVRVHTIEDDDDDEESSDEEESDAEEEEDEAKSQEEDNDDDDDDDDDDDEKEEVTSFWEKQSLLVLAAEHDRVDILKAILTEEDEDCDLLMKEGIPPLHISISFGSTNATQSLLRMGADPSIRPNVAEIKQKQQEQQKESSSSKEGEGSKVEIPNMQRFDGISAWELAFGNQKYEQYIKNNNNSKSWSLFGKSSSTLGEGLTSNEDGEQIIKPVDMAPSKREGVRHAFTAESLRCIGGDEVDRLRQLLDSGMPPSIDIGGKDLYGWAVEMGAMKCEELLRPIEAAKHAEKDEGGDKHADAVLQLEPDEKRDNDKNKTSEDQKQDDTAKTSPSTPTSFRILDRPNPNQQGEHSESLSLLINRLDELESLATALSTCLDNLAEEVSVCHGLLLMGGGASALAAHVKSLKNLKYQKAQQLVKAQDDYDAVQEELISLMERHGDIAKQVPANLGVNIPFSRTESFLKKKRKYITDGDAEAPKEEGEEEEDEEEVQQQRRQLKAQIAASENKIRKLRSSIADLSDENTREMQEVEKRGLSGGIDLVRGLREEIRDLDYQLGETKSSHASCRAKIGFIHSKLGQQQQSSGKSDTSAEATMAGDRDRGIISRSLDFGSTNGTTELNASASDSTKQAAADATAESQSSDGMDRSTPRATDRSIEFSKGSSQDAGAPSNEEGHATATSRSLDFSAMATTNSNSNNKDTDNKAATATSERIATGDSQALSVRPTGVRGYFTVDLWQVLLRIIGFDRAANRRSVEAAQKQPTAANLMTV